MISNWGSTAARSMIQQRPRLFDSLQKIWIADRPQLDEIHRATKHFLEFLHKPKEDVGMFP